ncbi:HAD family phosphatase [Gilvimarinus agarilyticus]|uniref:HAD family hydrolase n=1 Tax=unclassified Gilvimarinus TaxID=2642066 RepID=UPI001C08B3F2|nr:MULTISPECIES: HAD family phosphatase [unclassified Gilvimarinus]MBU2884550.1 HAD family phosphatase [Gilvimarinus agarilyticus]MDO6569678.1 HAD family phosphatase [Gilvimarinus sp. 2_MG-2023]MDO6747995.1 HAD family phosphatase [Gilvimarinus sp. 1_MG-2023]
MLQGVIFDHDGTLVDSERKHYQLWADLLSEFGVDFSEQIYRDHLAGIPTTASAEYLTTHYSLPITAQALYEKRERANTVALSEQACPLIAGALALVQWVHSRNLAMAIATGAPEREVEPTLVQHGLGDYFPIVASRDKVERPKPAPDVYQHALTQMQLKAAQCIAIEDSATGLQSALACGLECIVVRNDYSRGHNFAGASAVFEHMDEVKNYLAQRL